jgi:hypothetical protein
MTMTTSVARPPVQAGRLKYSGSIHIRDRSQPLTDRFAPTAEIEVFPMGETLTGEFMGMSRAEFHAVHTGKMVVHTRRSDGAPSTGEGQLRNMEVVAGGETVAKVVIDGCTRSQISLVVGNETQTLEGKAMGSFLFYRAAGMNIRLRLMGEQGAEAEFGCDDERWLYPLMAIAHHLWCKAWA